MEVLKKGKIQFDSKSLGKAVKEANDNWDKNTLMKLREGATSAKDKRLIDRISQEVQYKLDEAALYASSAMDKPEVELGEISHDPEFDKDIKDLSIVDIDDDFDIEMLKENNLVPEDSINDPEFRADLEDEKKESGADLSAILEQAKPEGEIMGPEAEAGEGPLGTEMSLAGFDAYLVSHAQEGEGEQAVSVPQAEEIRQVQECVSFLRVFPERNAIRGKAAERFSEMERILKYAAEFHGLFDGGVSDGMDAQEGTAKMELYLENLHEACNEYIANKSPILPRGRKRKNLVRQMRDKVQYLEDHSNAWEWEFMMNVKLQQENSDGWGGVDDGDPNKNNGKKKAAIEERESQERFAGALASYNTADALPEEFSINMEKDAADAGVERKTFQELTKDRNYEEIGWAVHARVQLQVVKLISCLFGVSDYSNAINPENLLYDEAEGEIKSIQLTLLPGITGVSEYVSKDEAERFLKEFAGDDISKMEKTIANIDRGVRGHIDMLSATTGVSRHILLLRLNKFLDCLRARMRGHSLDDMIFA